MTSRRKKEDTLVAVYENTEAGQYSLFMLKERRRRKKMTMKAFVWKLKKTITQIVD